MKRSNSVRQDPEADGVGFVEAVVRENGDLGKTVDSEPPEIRDVGDFGCGELTTAAFDEIREAADLDRHDPHTVVATIWIDLDEWDYSIEWHAGHRRGLVTRLRERL